MKTTLTALAITIALSFAAIADPAKRCAFGAIQFGESSEAAQSHLQSIITTAKKPLTVSDAFTKLTGNGAKFPPRLANRYSKVMVTVTIPREPLLSWVMLQTQPHEAPSYQGQTHDDWETLRDMCNAKFGQPTTTMDMPNMENLGMGFNATDTWELGTLHLRVTLGINQFGTAENPRHSITVRVQDTTP